MGYESGQWIRIRIGLGNPYTDCNFSLKKLGNAKIFSCKFFPAFGRQVLDLDPDPYVQ
jgi:hypothetical protein